jgi:hypothetical protein
MCLEAKYLLHTAEFNAFDSSARNVIIKLLILKPHLDAEIYREEISVLKPHLDKQSTGEHDI